MSYFRNSQNVWYFQSDIADIWSTEDMEDKLAGARRTILDDFDKATKVMGTESMINNTTHCGITGVTAFEP